MDEPGTARPFTVVRAARSMAAAIGWSAILLGLALSRVAFSIVPLHVRWTLLAIFFFQAAFVGLIWHGVGWAWSLVLVVVACKTIVAIWLLMAALAFGHFWSGFTEIYRNMSVT